MKWRIFLFAAAFTILFSNQLFAQCEVTGSVNPTDVVCGDCATLTAFGRSLSGQVVFNDNFNTGIFSAGWGSTQQALFNNPCSPNGVDGTTHVWMGNSGPVPRIIRTQSYNFTTAVAGVTVCFDLLFAEQTGDPATAPCEGPDEPSEGVALQYSTDGGNTWITIQYFDPNGGSDPQLINWNNWCFQLPPGAITTQTQIRFFQDFDSGADYDHWGIDNFVIYYNDPTFQITWQHDNYSYGIGNSGGANPNLVCPQGNSTYIVVMSNGTTTCRDTVSLSVSSPTIVVDAGNDTTICLGDCATLNATAKVVKRPAKTPTYRNGEVVPVPTAFGATGTININITDLNMTTVLPNSIMQVCIENLSFFGFNFFPPGQLTIGDLNVNLLCPDGTRILLVPSGVTTSTQGIQGYVNTCFTPAATANIGAASPPYSGTYAPNQPFNNLVGCTANGLWSIEISPAGPLGFGFGFFYGWSISFDDPEISYVADFTWSPTTNMTNANTLSPTVCPTSNQTYTLTAEDTAGCVIASDAVNITVTQTCCNLAFTATSTPPSCTVANGTITVNVTSGSGNYSFLWNDNQTMQNRTGLAAGTYSVTVTDITQACQLDTTITLTPPNAPVINSVNVTHETCFGDADGTATANASGGTGTLTSTWSTSQTGQPINNIPAGNHSVTVTDANSCSDVETFTINPGAVCCTLQIAATATQPGCGLNDGGIDLTVVTGSGNCTFLWSTNAITEDLTNVGAGSYSVTVTDVTQNCDRDTVITLSNPNAPTITSITSTAETCLGDADGATTVAASGGTGALTYLWSNNETTATITALAPATYFVTVSDANNCETSASVVVQAGQVCCALTATVTTINTSCNAADGSLTIIADTASGDTPFEYSIDGVNYVSANTFGNLAEGTYDAIVRDVNLCADTNTVTISEANNSIVVATTSTDITCFGDSDGEATVAASGGNAPLTILWSTNSNNDTINNLLSGTYYVTVTDQTNCERVDSAIVNEPAQLLIDLGDDQSLCVGESATFTLNGNFATIQWSTGDSIASVTLTQAGAVSVQVTNANGCTATDNATVIVNAAPTVNAGLDTTIFDFETVLLNPTANNPQNINGFLWTPSTGLSCTACENPIASPDSTILYQLQYTDLNRCVDFDSLLVTVIDGEFFAIVPNAFTPNGDGENDFLFVYHKGLERLVFRIYNRWGSLIFETTDPTAGWNGTFKGKELNPDVFVYELYAEFFNFKAQRTTGSVTLLR